MESEVAITISGLILAICIGSGLLLISKKYSQFPFPLMLFITGIFFSTIGSGVFESVRLTHESVLFIYLPLILFESAVHFDFREFRRILVPGFLLATMGLLFSSFIIAMGLNFIFDIPIVEAFLYGCIASSTDPIAVLSIFKSLGVPKRLQFLVDGESFLNDATSVVLYKIVLTFIAAGFSSSAQILDNMTLQIAADNILQFCVLLFGGAVVGIIVGWIASEIIAFVKNNFIVEVALTFILASGLFIIAEEVLGVSGIIAVLAAGLILGNYGKEKISPESREVLNATWEQIGFITTSLVFLLIGYEIDFEFIFENFNIVVAGTLLLLISRTLAVHGFISLFNILSSKSERIPITWQIIVNIGGIRGVLPFILLVSLDNNLVPEKEIFLQLILTAILVTLIVNTLLITPLIRLFKINTLTRTEDIEKDLTEIIFYKSMLKNISELQNKQELCNEVCFKHREEIELKLKTKIDQIVKSLKDFGKDYENELEKVLKLYFIQIEKSAYKQMHINEVIDLNLYSRLISSLDIQVEQIENGENNIKVQRTDIKEKFKKFKTVNFSVITVLNRLFRGSFDDLVADTYLYYKARLIGDDRVSEEIENMFTFKSEIFDKQILGKILSTYQKLRLENEQTLRYIRAEYKNVTNRVEEQIYVHELKSLRKKLKHEFAEGDRISEKALNSLQV